MRHHPVPVDPLASRVLRGSMLMVLFWAQLAQADQRIWNPYVHSAPGATAAKIIEPDEGCTALRQLNWRRSTMGLPPLADHPLLDQAAGNHSRYLSTHSTSGHTEVSGSQGFTGADPGARLSFVGYPWSTYGEVVSAGPSTGPLAVEALMEAIYHRFGMLRTDVTEVGAGFDTSHPVFGAVFTMNLGARQRVDALAGQRWLGQYPVPGQTGVPIDFYSDNESPDPVASTNRVGYPVSVHSAASDVLTLTTFSLSRGGVLVPTLALAPGSDAHTPTTAAAIIPLQPLVAGQTYTASFRGKLGSTEVSKEWTFTTAAPASIRTIPAALCYRLGSPSGVVTLVGGTGTFTRVGWTGSAVGVAFESGQTLRLTPLAVGTTTVTVTDSDNATAQFAVQVSSVCDLSATPVNQRLFNWAETAFARYLAPAGVASVVANGMEFRHYTTTNAYLGVQDGVVYFLDSTVGIIQPLGSLIDLLPAISQAGF